MIKKDLIDRLAQFDDYDVVVFVDIQGGWCNLQDVKSNGSIIELHEEANPPFHDRE